MSSVDSAKRKRSGWKLPAIALLWSEWSFNNFYYNEELNSTLKSLHGIEMMVWLASSIGWIVYLTRHKGRWVFAAGAAMVFGIVRISLIDSTEREMQRLQVRRPALEARLPEILSAPLAPSTKDMYGIYAPQPDIRVILDDRGKRQIAFIRFHHSSGNTLVYIYSSTNTLALKRGDTLFGFGQLDRYVSRNDHWFLCYFS